MKELNELEQKPVQELDRSQFPESVKKEENESSGAESDDTIQRAFASFAARIQEEEEKEAEAKEMYEKAKAERDEVVETINDMKENGIIDSEELDDSDDNLDDEEYNEESSFEDEEEMIDSTMQSLSEEDEKELEEELKELLDEEEILDEEENDEKAKESLNKYKEDIRSRIKPAAERIDLSSYVISKEAISVNSTLDKSVEEEIIYPLYCSGRSTRMKRFFASDIERLNPDPKQSGLNRLETMKKVYRTFYDKITDVHKPKSFEQWLRTTSFMDIKHLYMAAYKSAFDGSNFITYTCEECDNMWLSDNIDIDDMIEFKDDAVKEEFYKLLEKESAFTDKLYTTEIIPISDTYAFSFHEPSIYNVVFENSSLPIKVTTKYADMLSILMYIDTIYKIDHNTHSLKPIALKEFRDSIANTTKVKIYTYSKILRSLTSDQFQSLGKYMNKINLREKDIAYYTPEAICPECGHKIERVESDPMQLVFRRHSLEAIANS